MKRFLLAPVLLLASSVVQSAAAEDIKVVASPIAQAGESSLERTLNWANFIAKDPTNSPATEIDGFTVVIQEDREPGNRKVTKYLTTWRFHNFTEDNKHAAPLQLTVTLYDKSGHVVESYEEKSPRGLCTYNPQFLELQPEPIIAKSNRIEDIDTAVLRVTYSATYEGSC